MVHHERVRRKETARDPSEHRAAEQHNHRELIEDLHDDLAAADNERN